ncbi:hypothetical protein HPB47_025276 [Ixodes persulcatus]|uniref:Uncharacterized protein n=1 Tax=Ixodes persulcatus TaxID=34615 RepID=A0AC60Q2B4_IXOPE|nr:hypothetical protein HPB47_025276 [Ixodes persulcatus]
MNVIEVEGEDISPEPLQEPGMRGSLRTSEKKRGKPPLGSALRARRPAKAPRQPQLPAEDLKVILRLRGGFDAAQLRTVAVRDGVLRAAGIS